MYYLKIDDNNLIKYKVTFDENNLKKIYLDVLYNCAQVVPRCYKASYEFNSEYDVRIRNFKKEFLGYKNNSSEKIYKYEYEEYLEPNLCLIINDLLRGNSSSLIKLYEKSSDYDNNLGIANIDRDLSSLSIVEVEKLKNDLTLYHKYLVINKDRKIESEELYYDLVIKELNFEEIDRIPLSVINEYYNILTKIEILEKEKKDILEKRKDFFLNVNILEIKDYYQKQLLKK